MLCLCLFVVRHSGAAGPRRKGGFYASLSAANVAHLRVSSSDYVGAVTSQITFGLCLLVLRRISATVNESGEAICKRRSPRRCGPLASFVESLLQCCTIPSLHSAGSLHLVVQNRGATVAEWERRFAHVALRRWRPIAQANWSGAGGYAIFCKFVVRQIACLAGAEQHSPSSACTRGFFLCFSVVGLACRVFPWCPVGGRPLAFRGRSVRWVGVPRLCLVPARGRR